MSTCNARSSSASGVFGRWDDPYLTMSFAYEAAILETFYGFFEKGFVYKGLKPVFWCIHDRTALAEAEVEYEQHTSPSVYVRYRLTSDPATLSPALAGARGLHDHLDDDAVDHSGFAGRRLQPRDGVRRACSLISNCIADAGLARTSARSPISQ